MQTIQSEIANGGGISGGVTKIVEFFESCGHDDDKAFMVVFVGIVIFALVLAFWVRFTRTETPANIRSLPPNARHIQTRPTIEYQHPRVKHYTTR